MTDLVNPIPKKGGRSPQRQRRAQWEAEYEQACEVVRERSKGWCEVAGCDRAATQTHHKKGRRAPDSNHPDHLLDVCLEDHNRIHANPAWAYDQGYLLRRT